MKSNLPIGIDELLGGAVETARLELKASWDVKTSGPQVLETICAFANDLQNLNGGYVVLGVGESDGVPVRPVKGLAPEELDAMQKWVAGNCALISPTYFPVLSPETIDGKFVLVLWVPASDNRPHQAPSSRKMGHREFFVRVGSSTKVANDDVRLRLLQQTARIPFDDRRANGARIEDLREARVREFLRDVHSALVDESSAERMYSAMQLTRPDNGHVVPRNIALLFFADDPQRWFRGARIEIAQFAGDVGGKAIAEQSFRGPVHEQIRQCLSYLDNFSTHHLEKVIDRAQTRGWASYPSLALREALVNAIYHRGYEDSVEPTKVYLYPDRIEVISYPGPVDGIEIGDLTHDRAMPPVPARNRRIGELLKELRLAEGRGTGVPGIFRSMRNNGSPKPSFEFDPARSYFRVTLPAHPEYVGIAALRDAAYLEATGDADGALERLLTALAARPSSPLLTVAAIRQHAARGNLDSAMSIYHAFPREGGGWTEVAAAFAGVLLAAGRRHEAIQILDSLPKIMTGQGAFEAAILERRADRQERAHELFKRAGDSVLTDVRALHEFAQTKIKLADPLHGPRRGQAKKDSRTQLLREAEELLQRVVQLDAPPTRHGWAWFDLGRVRGWLKQPASDVIDAFERAVSFCPNEVRIDRALRKARGHGPDAR